MAGTVPLVIELDENAPIKSLAALHRIPGLAKIHFSFDVFDKPRAARREMLQLPSPTSRPGNRLGTAHDGFSPSEAVLALLKAHGGPMTRKEVKAAGGENGERMTSNMGSMVSAGLLKKVAPATYDLVERVNGHQASATKTTTNGAVKTTGAAIILHTFGQKKKGEIFSRKDFADQFELHGRSRQSVGDQLSKLVAAKKVKSVGKNQYVLA